MPPRTQHKRGAKASRSSFRKQPEKKATKATKATSKATPKAATPKAAKPKAKTKPAVKLRAAKRATAKSSTPRPQPEPETWLAPFGEITVPSGQLAVFDIGLVGYLPRPALEPAIVKVTVPSDRPLPVIGVPVGRGRFADCWDHVAVVLGKGDVHNSKKLGEVGVDFARIVCMDHAALDHWEHEDSLDGKADFVFWGRDELPLARATGAKRVDEGYGWRDLPVAEAEAKADRAARLKAEHRWLLATDLRPHSHHYHVLADARSNAYGAGALELAGSRLVLFFTSWGDGVFPVYVDLDGEDHPLQIRIQLATAERSDVVRGAMPAVAP